MDATPGHLQAQKIIIIHPGSQYIRIGRASDLNPVTILHAVGRKRRLTKGKPHHDTLLPMYHPELQSEFEEQRLKVSHTIQAHASTMSEERGSSTKRQRRVTTPPQQIATYNRRSVPEELEVPAVTTQQSKTELADIIFDADILGLSAVEAALYDIHFPMRCGELHLHDGIGGSIEALQSNMEAIWLHAIKHHMGIAPSDLPLQYRAVLVTTDVYDRNHLREFVCLLLQRLRFRACFLLQDHVAATFGAGLGYACVVDIGDQKGSISCVEDGISQPATRVRLSYGGGDVTRVFFTQLRKCCFPYKECDVDANYADAALLQQLKEHFCHINLNVCGAQERSFEVKRPNKHLRYTLQLGDECIVAPLALFHTELLNITGKSKFTRTQLSCSQQPNSEDCFDADYIRETGRRNGGRDQEGVMLPVTGETAEDDMVVVDTYDAAERETNVKVSDKDEQHNYMHNGQIVSLDQAVVRCIEHCASEDLKRKMYGCILLVGGSSKITGLTKWLEQRIMLQLGSLHRSATQPPFAVNVFTKEMDAVMIAWKGAAIMSCLDSASELWIWANEWQKHGMRILREKAPFIW